MIVGLACGTTAVVPASAQPSYEELSALVIELRAVIVGQQARIAELAARLNQSSKNSSRPASSDSPFTKDPAKPRSSRTRTGKHPGKQKGAGGSVLQLVDDPDLTVPCPPAACGGCGKDLVGVAPVKTRRHQVVDVPPPVPKAFVTEYQVATAFCPGCGTRTEGAVPSGSAGRVRYGPGVRVRAAWLVCGQFFPARRAHLMISALLGIGVSTGLVPGGSRPGRAAAGGAVRAAGAGADRRGTVAHADETCARAARSLRYLHIACTDYLTVIHSRDRTAETIDASGVWPAFTGC